MTMPVMPPPGSPPPEPIIPCITEPVAPVVSTEGTVSNTAPEPPENTD